MVSISLSLEVKKNQRTAKQFVSTLKKFLKAADIRPKHLSEITGYPTRTIQRWLAGRGTPSPERIEVIKTALHAQERAARQFADAIAAAFGA